MSHDNSLHPGIPARDGEAVTDWAAFMVAMRDGSDEDVLALGDALLVTCPSHQEMVH